MFGQACASNPNPTPANDSADERDSQASALYEAVLSEFKEREIPLYIDDSQKKLVISERVSLNTEVRKRYIARVVAVQQGLAFNLTVEYERRDVSGEHPVWVRAEDGPTLQRAHREEQQLGKAIQAKFSKKNK